MKSTSRRRWNTRARVALLLASAVVGTPPARGATYYFAANGSDSGAGTLASPYLSIADQALEMMRKLMTEFGLTPSSRSRIRVPGDPEGADELDRFLEEAS